MPRWKIARMALSSPSTKSASLLRAARSATLLAVGAVVLGATAGAHHDGVAPPAPDGAQSPPVLPSTPQHIVAEAGIRPTSAFWRLDRFSEFIDRTVFSLGIPSLRARVALAQAAERVAEIRALERDGALSVATLRDLLGVADRRLAIANRTVARRLATGEVPHPLMLLLVRTRLSAAAVLEELSEELGGDIDELSVLLHEAVDRLVAVDRDLLPSSTPLSAFPPDVLRELAADAIARAERTHDDVLAHLEQNGRAEDAPRDVQSLTAAKTLFASGDGAQALLAAREAQHQMRDLANATACDEGCTEPNPASSVDPSAAGRATSLP